MKFIIFNPQDDSCRIGDMRPHQLQRQKEKNTEKDTPKKVIPIDQAL
jgi:hypothetical protein